MYNTKDLAIIIPTKDRPVEVKRHLQGLVKQKCKLGRVIVVASGQDIKEIVVCFKDSLPVEYYRSEPGQIRQRNVGISKLDERTKLVASMDDDVTYHEDAVAEMIRFWNSISSDTAGVGFNIITLSVLKHNWFLGFIGFSSAKPGQVLKSGFNTSINNVEENIKVQWLTGGSSVWRQDILLNNPMEELYSNWAISEDLLFSYPLGKQYPLYICSGAKVETEEIVMDRPAKEFYIYRGSATYLWGLYFVMKNEDLSVNRFIINQFIYSIAQILKGTIYLDKSRFFITWGIIKAFIISLKASFGFQNINEFKIKFIDSSD